MINIGVHIDCTCYNSETEEKIRTHLMKHLTRHIKEIATEITVPSGRHVYPDYLVITGKINIESTKVFA